MNELTGSIILLSINCCWRSKSQKKIIVIWQKSIALQKHVKPLHIVRIFVEWFLYRQIINNKLFESFKYTHNCVNAFISVTRLLGERPKSNNFQWQSTAILISVELTTLSLLILIDCRYQSISSKDWSWLLLIIINLLNDYAWVYFIVCDLSNSNQFKYM